MSPIADQTIPMRHTAPKGKDIIITPPLIAIFWKYVNPTLDVECWEWQGDIMNKGYGRFRLDDRWYLAHRVSYCLHYHMTNVPEGYSEIDHLCRNRKCVNPGHLEAVTAAENQRRGEASIQAKAWFAAITQCPKGHMYSPENTRKYAYKDGYEKRHCRACDRIRLAQRYATDPPKRRAIAHAWRLANLERARANKRRQGARRRARQKQALIDATSAHITIQKG